MASQPRAMKFFVNLLLSLTLLTATTLTHVQSVNAAPADALVATAWFTFYPQLLQNTEGFTPPVAARAIGYAGVTPRTSPLLILRSWRGTGRSPL